VSDASSASCTQLGGVCKDLTYISEDSVPPAPLLCDFMSCLKENKTTCGDDLYYTVFGTDYNASLFNATQCPSNL